MWTQYLDRPALLEGLYQYGPVLTGFRLSELSWEHDGQACILRGTLSQFADFPRPHWEEDANRVGIRLRLRDVVESEFEGAQFYEPIDLSIEAIEGGTQFVVTAGDEHMALRIVCQGMSVEDVFAYHSLDAD